MNPTPTISEAARRAAEQEIDEFLYRSRITQPRRPFESGHYVQSALDSAHPAPKEGETPETDAAVQEMESGWGYVQAAPADFARSLELRLSEAKREVEALKKSANFHRDLGITLLDAKWLDPACHKGCQSLVLRSQLKTANELLGDIKEVLETRAVGHTIMYSDRVTGFISRIATHLNQQSK